jgi:hypothetical protein
MSDSVSRLNRRQFISQSAIAGAGFQFAGGAPGLLAESLRGQISCDVLVCSATPGGIAAAITAARLGHSVILAEYEDHIGGIISNGLTNTDLYPEKRNATGGFFNEYSANVLHYYSTEDTGGATSPNIAACHVGFYYEAKVAELLFGRMLKAEPNIRLLLQHELIAADVGGNKVTTIKFRNRQTKNTVHIKAKIYIDATYEGDLAAMSKLPYRVGRESRNRYNEAHAGRIYMRFGTNELLPGSTGEGDNAIQAFCFRFIVTKRPSNRATILKPATYNRDDYKYLLADIRAGKITKFEQVFGIFALPNGKYQLNSLHAVAKTGVPSESLDLAEENWAWPESTPIHRHKIYERYRDHNVGLIWMLQNDEELPASLRDGSREYGWCRDEWINNGNIPRQVYMREARRIQGLYNVTENDGNLDSELQRTALRPDSIAVVQWEFDSHACHKFSPEHPGVREGYTFVPHTPFQVPYGTIVPQQTENVLVPVACSTSHVAYNALRMEPVFMALGQASGIAAHLAITDGISVADVKTDLLQQQIVAQQGVVTYIEDVKFSDPDFAAFQWLGARGFNQGYVAKPEQSLSTAEAAGAFQRVMFASGKSWKPPVNVDGQMSGHALQKWLLDAGYSLSGEKAFGSGEFTVRQMAAVLFSVMTAAHTTKSS